MRIYPVFIPHSGCPFKCIYCNQNIITRKSDFSIHQFKPEIDRFLKNDASQEREVAFFGGTFTSLPESEQIVLLESVTKSDFYDSETTSIRFSTRPDSFLRSNIELYKYHNVSVVELGIQSFSDVELKETRRGYNSETASKACELVKSEDFKLCVQLMPGLPGYNDKTFKETLRLLKAAAPDYVRIYPVIVLKGTELESIHNHGDYSPLELNDALTYSVELYKECLSTGINVIKVGLHSDVLFDSDNVIAGPYHPAFGELLQAELFYEQLVSTYKAGKTLHISPRDISLLKGFNRKYLNKLKTTLNIQKVPIIIDNFIKKRHFKISEEIAERYF